MAMEAPVRSTISAGRAQSAPAGRMKRRGRARTHRHGNAGAQRRVGEGSAEGELQVERAGAGAAVAGKLLEDPEAVAAAMVRAISSPMPPEPPVTSAVRRSAPFFFELMVSS